MHLQLSLMCRNSPTTKVAMEHPTTAFINAAELSNFGRMKADATYIPIFIETVHYLIIGWKRKVGQQYDNTREGRVHL